MNHICAALKCRVVIDPVRPFCLRHFLQLDHAVQRALDTLPATDPHRLTLTTQGMITLGKLEKHL